VAASIHLLAAGQTSGPNIVFIMADDLGLGDVSHHTGHLQKRKPVVQTPAVDALAREGMWFTDAHSSTSLCYLPGGMAWYRKRFQSLGTDVTYLHFDGIYNNAAVYLNGKKPGKHPYGYSPFLFDISADVIDGENLLAVRVDHSRYCDSRWYTGSGIYREVKVTRASSLCSCV